MDTVTNKELAIWYWKVVTQFCESSEKSRYYYRKGLIERCSVGVTQQFEKTGNLDGVPLPNDVKFVLMLIFTQGLERARNTYPEIIAERDGQFKGDDNVVFFSREIVPFSRTTERSRTPRRLPTRR